MVDRDMFLIWAESRLGDVRESGAEVMANSPWATDPPDRGHHLYCNWEKNCFHCWKSERSGNLYELVCEIDNCSFERARVVIGDDDANLRRLEARVREVFAKKKKEVKQLPSGLQLPPETYPVSEVADEWRRRAEEYLSSRKIPSAGLMVCVGGKFFGRVVIPYYGRSGELIYYNARDITGRSGLRYMGPPKEVGVGKGDVLWVSEWPRPGGKLYLAEGEFDAMSLRECGLPAAACGGKQVTVAQRRLLDGCHVVVCFDEDKSGKKSLNKSGWELISNNFPLVSYVRPARNYKDWNNMLVKLGPEVVKHYITSNERRFVPELFPRN